MAVSECAFGTGPAAEVGAGDVREAEAGLGVVVAIEEILELASEGDAEFDADSVNIAEKEVGKAVPVEAGPEPKSVAELGLVVSVHDTYHKLSSEVAVAWNFGVPSSLRVVFEPMVEFVVASQAEYMMAPCERIQGALLDILTGSQLGATAVVPELLDKPETVELELLAEHIVGELNGLSGRWPGFVTLVWVSTAETVTDPGDNLESNKKVVL